MIKSKKIISLFVSAAMLITMLSSFTTVAYADEAAYTTHAWYTFEDGKLPAGVTANTGDTSEVDLGVDGQYRKGVKVTKKTELLSTKKYPELKVTLDEAITIDEAIAENLTVEIEINYKPSDLPSENTYFYLCDDVSDKYNSTGNAYMSLKQNGELKTRTLKKTDGTDNSSDEITISTSFDKNEWQRVKLVLNASAAAQPDQKGWILSKVYYNGNARSSSKWGQCMFTVDLLCLAIRMDSPADDDGHICLDNISITSYPTPEDGKSPVPNRHTFMKKVLEYKDTLGTTPAYQYALDVFERPYITSEEINDAYYVLAGNSNMYTIHDIGTTDHNVKLSSTDTVGGTPILVVCAFNRAYSKLYASQCIPITGLEGDGTTEKRFYYNLGELPEDAKVIKAFVFSSLDSLIPLAKPRAE